MVEKYPISLVNVYMNHLRSSLLSLHPLLSFIVSKTRVWNCKYKSFVLNLSVELFLRIKIFNDELIENIYSVEIFILQKWNPTLNADFQFFLLLHTNFISHYFCCTYCFFFTTYHIWNLFPFYSYCYHVFLYVSHIPNNLFIVKNEKWLKKKKNTPKLFITKYKFLCPSFISTKFSGFWHI